MGKARHGRKKRNPAEVCYETAYNSANAVTVSVLKKFHRSIPDPVEHATAIANAQAEALVYTLRKVAMKVLPKNEHAEYLHWLFSLMMTELLHGRKALSGRVLVTGPGKRL